MKDKFSFRLGDLSLLAAASNGSIIKGKNVYLNISVLVLTLLVSSLILFSIASADVPKLINIQGSLFAKVDAKTFQLGVLLPIITNITTMASLVIFRRMLMNAHGGILEESNSNPQALRKCSQSSAGSVYQLPARGLYSAIALNRGKIFYILTARVQKTVYQLANPQAIFISFFNVFSRLSSKLLVLSVLIFFVSSIPLAAADVPKLINIQGKLTDANKNPLTNSVNLIILSVLITTSLTFNLMQKLNNFEKKNIMQVR